jgi:hypothetical protein
MILDILSLRSPPDTDGNPEALRDILNPARD